MNVKTIIALVILVLLGSGQVSPLAYSMHLYGGDSDGGDRVEIPVRLPVVRTVNLTSPDISYPYPWMGVKTTLLTPYTFIRGDRVYNISFSEPGYLLSSVVDKYLAYMSPTADGLIVVDTETFQARNYSLGLTSPPTGGFVAYPGQEFLSQCVALGELTRVIDSGEIKWLPDGYAVFNVTNSIYGNLTYFLYLYNLTSMTIGIDLYSAAYSTWFPGVEKKWVLFVVENDDFYGVNIPDFPGYRPLLWHPLAIVSDGNSVRVVAWASYIGQPETSVREVGDKTVEITEANVTSVLLVGDLDDNGVKWRIYNLTLGGYTYPSVYYLMVKSLVEDASPGAPGSYLLSLGLPWNRTVFVPFVRDVLLDGDRVRLYLEMVSTPGFSTYINDTELYMAVGLAVQIPLVLSVLLQHFVRATSNASETEFFVPLRWGAILSIGDHISLQHTSIITTDPKLTLVGPLIGDRLVLWIDLLGGLVRSLIFSQLDPGPSVGLIGLALMMAVFSSPSRVQPVGIPTYGFIHVWNATSIPRQGSFTPPLPVLAPPITLPVNTISPVGTIARDYEHVDDTWHVVLSTHPSVTDFSVSIVDITGSLTYEELEEIFPLELILENSNGQLELSLNNSYVDLLMEPSSITGVHRVMVGLSRLGDYVEKTRFSMFTPGHVSGILDEDDRTVILLDGNSTVYLIINESYYKILKDGVEVSPTSIGDILVFDPANITILWSPPQNNGGGGGGSGNVGVSAPLGGVFYGELVIRIIAVAAVLTSIMYYMSKKK